MVTPKIPFRSPLIQGLVALRIVLVILFFVPAQTIFLDGLKIDGVKPDLGLILTYSMGLTSGYKQGLIGGLLFGGLQDISSLGPLGLHSVLNGFIGLSIGLLERSFLYVSLRTHIFIIFLTSLFHEVMGEIGTRGLLQGLRAISGMMVGQALYNSLIGIGILFILSLQGPSKEESWMERYRPS